ENMAATVRETLEKFGLVGRIIAFVMDNATNNDTMIDAIADRCTIAQIPFSEKNARMQCLPHTIHLAALKLLEAIGAIDKVPSTSQPYQDAVTAPVDRSFDDDEVAQEDGEDDVLDASAMKYSVLKLRKIVRHVRSSPQRRRAWLREVQAVSAAHGELMQPALMLILDVKTHWSSTHQMLSELFCCIRVDVAHDTVIFRTCIDLPDCN
ncbi:hypothetical protein BT96DRAFT_843731, partial [Gymnopus androsaceus JB14]